MSEENITTQTDTQPETQQPPKAEQQPAQPESAPVNEPATKNAETPEAQKAEENKEAEPSSPAPKNLFKVDEDDAKKDGEPPPPDEKAMSSFVDEISAILDKDSAETPIDKDALKEIAPDLMSSGISKEKAAPIISKFAKHLAEQSKAFAKSQEDIIRNLTKETKDYFGADLKKFISEAKVGGKHIFGERWAFYEDIPALANDRYFIEGLSKIGRSVSSDKGIGGSNSGPKPDGGFDLERWSRASQI